MLDTAAGHVREKPENRPGFGLTTRNRAIHFRGFFRDCLRCVGGKRRVVKISEVTGTEGDVLSMHDIFEFQTAGVNSNGVAEGFFWATAILVVLK